ncbi:MAG TPA: tetratricopeptide repeat protein [Noviherbaspirillum sp.]|uniref:tetratricopeptide repeat protein n=1 Tax=Noviherbaspirillum sp. TaxID=1926288 RepID=UPI002B471364|nr:tetratricopeptide repeat protein [Noviherbaspirillum sp.]HJV85601.1 tetratricopeptide repeat protein [Noviherbaspirillum sp.]
MPVLITSVLAAGNAWAADAQMEKARVMLRDGKPADAYTLLEKQEFERAGDVEFDTLIGVAALDAGKADNATLAFERVLAVDPNAAGVRLDMARAYFALGDYPRAKQELDLVAQFSPPPAARLMIEKYRRAIEKREQAKRTIVTGYVEGFGGYDTNITSVVGDFTNAVLSTYNLPGFLPTGNAVKRSSGILGAAGGVEVTHQATDTISLSAGADVRHREVLRAHNYASDQIDLRAGISYAQGANLYRGGLTLQEYQQRTDVPSADRHSIGLNAEWRRTFSPSDQGSLFGLVTQQRYPDIAVNDVNTFAAGAAWLHQFNGARKPLLYASLLTGQDNAQNPLSNGSNYDKRFVNGRLYAQVSMSESADLFASIGLLYRGDRSPFARSTNVSYGGDHTSDVTLGWNWRPAPNWTVRPQVTYTENRSNIALNEYRRTETLVTVRYDLH